MSADCQIRIDEIEADVIGWYRSLFSEHPDDGPHPVSVNRLHLVDVCTGMSSRRSPSCRLGAVSEHERKRGRWVACAQWGREFSAV
jgi:hypothetical protein